MHDLRKQALRAFQAGVQAADPGAAVTSALADDPLAQLDGGKYLIIAVGKAALSMAKAALAALPDGADYSALAVTNAENAAPLAGCRVMPAGHPVPDKNGQAAARAVIDLLQSAGLGDVVLALVSGGSSAMLPAPVAGISLADKSQVNEVLLGAGFNITEMNLVRQTLSRLKGGGMLAMAAPATVRSLILSDVVGDDLRVVGSGPTVGPIGTVFDATGLLRDRGILDQMPDAVQTYLNNQTAADVPPSGAATLVGGNSISLAAMAHAVNARMGSVPLVGDVKEAAKHIVEQVRRHSKKTNFALAFGGETTVQVTGTGKGGRNQELALRVASGMKQVRMKGNWCFLSGGTDGRDGPTDAAGGLVDAGTLARVTDSGLDINALLANNDAYTALAASDDLVMTGGTGTNVADLQLFLYQS